MTTSLTSKLYAQLLTYNKLTWSEQWLSTQTQASLIQP